MGNAIPSRDLPASLQALRRRWRSNTCIVVMALALVQSVSLCLAPSNVHECRVSADFTIEDQAWNERGSDAIGRAGVGE
jgi:hypothetical protein